MKYQYRALLADDLRIHIPYGTMVVDAVPLMEFLPDLTNRTLKQVAPLGPSSDSLWIETLCGRERVGTNIEWSGVHTATAAGCGPLQYRFVYGYSICADRTRQNWAVGVHTNGMVLLFDKGSKPTLWGRYLFCAPEHDHAELHEYIKQYIQYELVYPVLWTLGFINGTDGGGKHSPRLQLVTPPRGTPNRANRCRYNVIYLPYRRSQCSEISNATGNPKSGVWFRRGHWYRRDGVKRWRRWHWCVGSAAQNAFVDKHYVARV